MATDTQLDLWEVFIQSKSGTPHKHAGSIHASDKNMALENARDIYTRRGEGRNIWVVLSDQIAASKTEDEAEFFDHAGALLHAGAGEAGGFGAIPVCVPPATRRH